MIERKLSSPGNDCPEFNIGDVCSFLQHFHDHYPYFLDFLSSGYGWDLLTSKRIAIDVFGTLWLKRRDFVSSRNVQAFLYSTCKGKSVSFLRYLAAGADEQYVVDTKLFDQLPQEIAQAFKIELNK